MKSKINFFVVFIVNMLILIPINVMAHPGGLDSSGCHYCRTNCSKWGLNTDEYHCHSGNTYSNSKGEIYDKSGSKINHQIIPMEVLIIQQLLKNLQHLHQSQLKKVKIQH